MLAIASPAQPAMADDDSLIKAKFVNLFANYVESGDKRLCVYASDEFFNTIRSASKSGAPIKVSSVDELKNCGVAYISKSHKSDVAELIQLAGSKKLVSISDADGFVETGGIVEIYEKEGKIKFALNLKKVNATGIKLNSKLVELADRTI